MALAIIPTVELHPFHSGTSGWKLRRAALGQQLEPMLWSSACINSWQTGQITWVQNLITFEICCKLWSSSHGFAILLYSCSFSLPLEALLAKFDTLTNQVSFASAVSGTRTQYWALDYTVPMAGYKQWCLLTRLDYINVKSNNIKS